MNKYEYLLHVIEQFNHIQDDFDLLDDSEMSKLWRKEYDFYEKHYVRTACKVFDMTRKQLNQLSLDDVIYLAQTWRLKTSIENA